MLRTSRLVPLIVLAGSAILLAGAPALAQPFQRVVGGLLDDQPHCIEHTLDGGTIIAGTESEMMVF